MASQARGRAPRRSSRARDDHGVAQGGRFEQIRARITRRGPPWTRLRKTCPRGQTAFRARGLDKLNGELRHGAQGTGVGDGGGARPT